MQCFLWGVLCTYLFLYSVRFQTTILFWTKVTFILKVTSVKNRRLHVYLCVTNLLWLCVLLSGRRRLRDRAAVSHVKLTVSSSSSCPPWCPGQLLQEQKTPPLTGQWSLGLQAAVTLHQPACWETAQPPGPKAEYKLLTLTQLSIWQPLYNTILSVPNALNTL